MIKKGTESTCLRCGDPIKFSGFNWNHIENGKPHSHVAIAPNFVQEIKPVEKAKPKEDPLSLISITRLFEFDTAHRVYKHSGKCNSLHGHRYKLEVTLEGNVVTNGMLMDFGVIKTIIGDHIDLYWDHTTVLKKDDPLIKLIEQDPEKTKPILKMECNPTVENMAVKLFSDISSLLFDKGIADVTLYKIRLYETPNCYADYYGRGRPTEIGTPANQ